jgi:hypothetical protein
MEGVAVVVPVLHRELAVLVVEETGQVQQELREQQTLALEAVAQLLLQDLSPAARAVQA